MVTTAAKPLSSGRTMRPALTASRHTAAPCRTEWLRLTLTSAALATLLDAALLERKKGLFTGGFLAADQLRTGGELATFVLASVVTDAALTGLIVTAGLWLARHLSLTTTARRAAILTLALAPIVVADLLAYQLVSYFGDAFDLALLFDLTGRDPEEFLAVASSHLVSPVLMLLVGATCLAGLIWGLNQARLGPQTRFEPAAGTRPWRRAAALCALGLCTSAALTAAAERLETGVRRKPSGRLFTLILESVTDVDRDGFGALARIPDPDPLDRAIYPFALDRPGNGLDENGIAGDLPPFGAYRERSGTMPRWSRTPNVVLVVLESFRADVPGSQLRGRPVTPVLDALAAQGGAASIAFSHNGYTAQSRYHLFSGSLAGLREGTTLIDDFKANGYEVACFSGQDESFGGQAFSAGFERADIFEDARLQPERRYSTFSTPGSLAIPYSVVLERVQAFLARRRSDKPLFLYVNFHDTHFPYHHGGVTPTLNAAPLERHLISPERADDLKATYLNTAANIDAAIGILLQASAAALGDEPAVIVTADHGESLFDEGFLGHGYALNEVQTRIPLIVRGLGMRIEQPFAQAELRDALGDALIAPLGEERPTFSTPLGKKVFQYLGNMTRPRQIALTSASLRTIYDFAEGRAHSAGLWWRPAEVSRPDAAAFEELVHFWERILNARARVP